MEQVKTSDKKPVLIILTPGFPAGENDSSCLPARQVFMRSLKENNPSLHILVLSFQYPHFKKKYRWHGIDVISYNGRNNGKLSSLSVWWKVWKELLQVKKQYKIKGLLSFWMGECSFIGKRFSKKYNVKFYSWILGQDARKGNRYFRFIKPRPDELIALSDFIAVEFERNYGIVPGHIIPVGIDTSMFNHQIKKDITIMGAGSLIPLKQYDVFIEVVKSLTDHFPQLGAMLCGKGVEKERLDKLIHNLDIQGNIILTGEVTHSEVINIMQRSKVFLHTSSYEGFGSVCAEALYAGCHVISFTRPMNANINHWHIVSSKKEMINKAIEVLNDSNTEYNPVLFYPVEYAAASMMRLFTYNSPQ